MTARFHNPVDTRFGWGSLQALASLTEHQTVALVTQPQIAERYRAAFDRLPTDDDVTALYERFMPLQIEKIALHSALIPGALDAIAALRDQGLKIGSCSGYPAVVMEKVVELARHNGYVADHVVATDEVPNGRPYPAQAQALANVIALGISDVAACVKVDDTWPGILEGRSAGMWTVALTCSGNALGLTYDQFKALSPDKLAEERARITKMFQASRPHYLIDTIVDLPAVIEDINARLSRGETPQSA
ncbi:Phosphonoacetaldehyde hydrolase [Pseudomonas fluorescens]|uniref:Phosphonoacetaldehyde hydrolase n=1 Tax=Pseudomonas fluorescens TaxID=294 RepID=A0A5E7MQ00_PSEFL|nr:Phosphonoacetaldehyde hydrolase [Pseudomonas fluorescens]